MHDLCFLPLAIFFPSAAAWNLEFALIVAGHICKAMSHYFSGCSSDQGHFEKSK
jgi:hypothetical protein